MPHKNGANHDSIQQHNPYLQTEHAEQPYTRTMAEPTSKMRADVFFWAAISAMVASLLLYCFGNEQLGLLIGQWSAPLLLLGIYNKL
jgi:hypothetical protein